MSTEDVELFREQFRQAALALADAIDIHWESIINDFPVSEHVATVQNFVDDYRASWVTWSEAERMTP